MDKQILLVDRSRTVVDWTCGRKRYHNYEYAGRGIVPANQFLELFLGTTIHDILAAIASNHKLYGGIDIDNLVKTVAEDVILPILEKSNGEVDEVNFANEQAALVEGMLRGFYRSVWPKLISEFPTIIAIEEEVEYKIDDHLIFMAKPDLVMADKDGNWCYIEYKSTSSKSESWINSWQTAIQLHSTVKAIEQTLGTAPTSVRIQGLYKGYPSYGKQNSPFCYAYVRQGQPPFSVNQTSYEYKAGFKRSPVWEMSGGVKKWVEEMPETILADQFPSTPPIFINDEMVMTFFKQRAWREHEIEMALDMMEDADEEARKGIMDVAFPQRFESCSPYFGKPCMYKQLCFGHVEDPLKEGWQLREAHHVKEQEKWDEANTDTER